MKQKNNNRHLKLIQTQDTTNITFIFSSKIIIIYIEREYKIKPQEDGMNRQEYKLLITLTALLTCLATVIERSKKPPGT